jgi:hypothetical protein
MLSKYDWTGGEAQMVEHLSSKYKALSSISHTAKQTNKQKTHHEFSIGASLFGH